MPDKEYATVAGFVQFDPQWREWEDNEILGITVQSLGSQDLVNISIWPEFDEEVRQDIERGDFVAVNGTVKFNEFTGDDGAKRESVNVSASRLAVLKPVDKTETNTPAPTRTKKRGKAKAGF